MALTYDEIDAHVRSKYIPVLVDQYFKSNPLWTQLQAKSKVIYDSGSTIKQPVLFGELNSGWYSGLDTFDITTKQTDTLAEFNWAQFYVNITLDGETELKVEGDEKILSIMATKMDNASKTFNKQMNQALYADQGAKAIRPLTEAVATSGTYGGISKSSYSWWQGNVNSTGGALTLSMLQSMYGDCSDGAIQPDLIVTTQDIYDKIWQRVQPQDRGNNENTPALGNVGFSGIRFNKATIVVDNYCNDGYIYFLNTDFWKLVIHKKRPPLWTPPKVPLNQDAFVRQLLWAGCLLCQAPRWQGYISNVS